MLIVCVCKNHHTRIERILDMVGDWAGAGAQPTLVAARYAGVPSRLR
jgi:hypothetical protein